VKSAAGAKASSEPSRSQREQFQAMTGPLSLRVTS
jgi:hypothetical protein